MDLTLEVNASKNCESLEISCLLLHSRRYAKNYRFNEILSFSYRVCKKAAGICSWTLLITSAGESSKLSIPAPSCLCHQLGYYLSSSVFGRFKMGIWFLRLTQPKHQAMSCHPVLSANSFLGLITMQEGIQGSSICARDSRNRWISLWKQRLDQSSEFYIRL